MYAWQKWHHGPHIKENPQWIEERQWKCIWLGKAAYLVGHTWAPGGGLITGRVNHLGPVFPYCSYPSSGQAAPFPYLELLSVGFISIQSCLSPMLSYTFGPHTHADKRIQTDRSMPKTKGRNSTGGPTPHQHNLQLPFLRVSTNWTLLNNLFVSIIFTFIKSDIHIKNRTSVTTYLPFELSVLVEPQPKPEGPPPWYFWWLQKNKEKHAEGYFYFWGR